MKVLPFFVKELRGHLIEEIKLIQQSIEEEKRLSDNSDFSLAFYHTLKGIVPKMDESVKLMIKLENYIPIEVALTLPRAHELNNMVFDLTETNKHLLFDEDMSIAKRTLYLMELNSICDEILGFLNTHVPTT